MLKILDVSGTQLMHAGCVFVLRPKACLPAFGPSTACCTVAAAAAVQPNSSGAQKSHSSSGRRTFRRFFNAGARLADASQAYRACPNLINSHTQMGGNHLDKKRDEIKTKSL